MSRVAPVRFGYGSFVERFERFRFSVSALSLEKGFPVFQYRLSERDGFGSWKTVLAVPVPISPVLLFLGVFVSLVFFLLRDSLVFLGCVSAYFPGFLRVRKVRKILGVFEVFLGIFEKTKEKKDRVGSWKNGSDGFGFRFPVRFL